MEQATFPSHGGEPTPLDSRGLCLLSLDGGGVRGLSTLYILKSITDQLNHDRKLNSLPPVKPCEVFDLIGGTNTGGQVDLFPADRDRLVTDWADTTGLLRLCWGD